MLVALIDYGSGNLRSAAKALEKAALDADIPTRVNVTDKVADVIDADRIVLPGVGAFADCRQGLAGIPGMIDALTEIVSTGRRPFLGICVGMQLFATRGFEHGEHSGLGWIPGDVLPISPYPDRNDLPIRVPHMGWNELSFKPNVHPLLHGMSPGVKMYFVHSYHFRTTKPDDTLATVRYGDTLSAMVGRETLVGVQFHPEKSQGAGLRFLANFLRWAP